MNPDTPFSALALLFEARSADQVLAGVEAAAKAGAAGVLT
jgi:hypothetical protein